ncbi:hypothetical protein L9G74_19130 [Shewanella sp. C32]|uniref:Uncharacterized protein n=1 Tax=Shewanella electrica TaxID=515560 RepID=A0ABT2FQD8_9GAMM|nr:hypothetical protein [Shewanella electrica]MCH1926857.1 hypothetical protein [Shewanella electrica]MCS4558554.1 hypothetical protein [Shewanella electrica]
MITLILDEPWEGQPSPLQLRFGDFDGEILRFDEAWQGQTSPLQLRFDGSDSGGGDGSNGEATPQILGINVGISWQVLQAITQQLALNEHATDIDNRLNLDSFGDHVDTKQQFGWHAETAVRSELSQGWYYKVTVLRRTAFRWALPEPHRINRMPWWHVEPAEHIRTSSKWINHKAQRIAPTQNFTLGEPAHQTKHVSWFGEAKRNAANVTWGPPQPRWVCTNRWFDLVPKGRIELRFDESYTEQQSPLQLRFDVVPQVCHWDAGGGYIPGNPSLPPIDFKVPIQPQIRRMYLMQPLLTCVRAADEQPIAISAVSINNSRSQFASSVSLTFCSKGDAIRAENNLLRIGINGYDFYAYAEQPSRSEAWNNNSYQSNGRGRTAELSTPWRRATSYSNSAARSIGGIASDLLQNTGWTVDVSAINDFTVPAGVCTISNTPIDALNEIASMIGCMLAADDETQVISILPRWPTVPWSMSSATPDAVISDSVILGHSVSTTVNPLCNACWLRGEQQGISAKVTRDGSAGDLPTDDISNALIVDIQAARLAGTAALADTGEKQQISLTLPIMADLPPFKKGQLVGITWRGEQYRALCDSVNITATMNNDGRLTVRQQITVIRSME